MIHYFCFLCHVFISRAFIIVMIVDTTLKTGSERKIVAYNNSQIENDDRLITEAHSDPTAFARLYRRHYEAVFRYCVHRLFERYLAEDITSVVFLKVVENFQSFKGNELQFRNWLYKIATNAVNDHLRKSARRKTLLENVDNFIKNPGSINFSDEKLAFLKQAMFELKPKYQTIITLRFFENLKLTEIAEMLGSSPGTIRSRLARALAKLRKKLDVWEADFPAGGYKNEE